MMSGAKQTYSNSKGKSPSSAALDDILGRARSTLNQSRQFRDSRLESSKAKSHPKIRPVASSNNNSKPSKDTVRPNEGFNFFPIPSIIFSFLLPFKVVVHHPRGKPSSNIESLKAPTVTATVSSYRDDSSLSSNESGRLMKRGSESDDNSDSTITPPTITDTVGSISVNEKRSKSRKNKDSVNEKSLLSQEMKVYPQPANTPRAQVMTKNLLEKTIMVRGDPISRETYDVIKEMSKERENKVLGPEETYSFQDDTYPDDFISEARTFSQLSIEAPGTESEAIEFPQTIRDDDEDSTSNTINSASTSLVEEIVQNLQSLEVSEHVINHADGKKGPDPYPDLYDDDVAAEDLDALMLANQLKLDQEDLDLLSVMERISFASSHDLAQRSKSVQKSSTSEEVASNQKSLSSKTSLSKQVKSKSTKTATSRSRLSEAQNFQLALSQIKLDEDELTKRYRDVKNANFNPPQSKAQLTIHQILKREVYVKELQRLRELHKKEEKILKKLNLVRAENMMKSKATEQGEKNYEVSASQLLLQNLYRGPTGTNPTEFAKNYGVPYFNRDGTLGLGQDFYAYENLPRTPDENFKNHVARMDVHSLVREVVASNERMYNMTVSAADQMAKQYGKDAKLLMKIKRRREERQK
jgi:hypothetical protein